MLRQLVGADARISLQQPGGAMQHQETAQPRDAGDCPIATQPPAAAGETPPLEPAPDDQGHPLQEALLSYLDSRRKALRLYGEAVDSGDDAIAEQAKAAARDASRALDELKKLSASNH